MFGYALIQMLRMTLTSSDALCKRREVVFDTIAAQVAIIQR